MDFVTAAADPISSHSSSTLRGTVAVVDMVGYSSTAKMLEENLGPTAVARLNRQIQAFVNQSLEQLPDGQAYRVISKTGDGAIVFFQHAENAHQFGVGVHRYAHEHTDQRTEMTAQRWFRVGIATGEVNVTSALNLPPEYAGIAIANAVRLETAASAGEIVVDANTFAKLSSKTQKLYGSEEVVHGKRDERFRAYRCVVTQQTAKPIVPQVHNLTRRRVLQLSAAVCTLAAGAGGAVWLRPKPTMKPPLPAKRSVALMPWPTATPESSAVIESLLTSIYTRVRRAERHIPDLVILDASDISEGTSADAQIQSDLKPREMAAIWGATLILTVDVEKQRLSDWLLNLKLLDSQGSQVLRDDSFVVDSARIQSAGEAASRSAAKLLELPEQNEPITDDDELAGVPALAQELLLEGRALGKQLNDIGLGIAIEKYKSAIAEYPDFALAYAERGHAFWRQFENTYDTDFVGLAEQDLSTALRLNPNSQRAHLGQCELLAGRGLVTDALRAVAFVLEADPENSEALFLRGRAFESISSFDKAEMSYDMLTKARPNYWKAYNNLGYVQYQQDRHDEALASFNRAAELAPLVAIPIANRGIVYSGMENRQKEAMGDLNRSIDLSPNETALSGLGDIAWEAKNYPAARSYFAKANSLEPLNHITWSDLGDTYRMLGQQAECQKCIAKAAELLRIHLTVNPKDGPSWMMLGLYHARLKKTSQAEVDIQKAEELRATKYTSLLIKARALAAMNRTREATKIVIENGISQADVDLAVELDQVRATYAYKSYIAASNRISP